MLSAGRMSSVRLCCANATIMPFRFCLRDENIREPLRKLTILYLEFGRKKRYNGSRKSFGKRLDKEGAGHV